MNSESDVKTTKLILESTAIDVKEIRIVPKSLAWINSSSRCFYGQTSAYGCYFINRTKIKGKLGNTTFLKDKLKYHYSNL